MSRAIPHYVRVIDASGQPARTFLCESAREARDFAIRTFRDGFAGCVVSIFEGRPDDGVAREPVKVWS